MWPMRRAHIVLKANLLKFKRLLRRKSPWRHTDILHVSDLIPLRQASIVHSPRIPEDKVPRVHIDLDKLASPVLEPLEVFLVEQKEIHIFELGRRCVLVVIGLALLREELVKEFRRAFHEH